MNNEDDIVYRLRKRAEIRRQIPGRKSVEEGTPDRIADLLEEAANETYWIDRQRCIKPYADAGWTEYIIEHGTDQLIVPCITPSASYDA